MALFPQTTCFYKALINKPPVNHTEEYEVLFEDPTYPEGFSPPLNVAQRYVILCKADNKGASASATTSQGGGSDSDSEEVYAR